MLANLEVTRDAADGELDAALYPPDLACPNSQKLDPASPTPDRAIHRRLGSKGLPFFCGGWLADVEGSRERESERSRAERRGIECGAVAVTGAVERIARSAG
jgi:hypothetical protein